MGELQLVQGRSIEEKIESIDRLLYSIANRPRKMITTNHFASVFSAYITQEEVAHGFFPVAGILKDLAFFSSSVPEKTELIVKLTNDDTVTTKRIPVESGLGTYKEPLHLEAYTKLTLQFSQPILGAYIGYTFTPDRGENETEIISNS